MPHFDGPHRWHCDLFLWSSSGKPPSRFVPACCRMPNSTSTELYFEVENAEIRDLDAWQIYRLQRVTSSRMPMLQLSRSFHQADILTDNSYVHLKNVLTDRRISMMTCGHPSNLLLLLLSRDKIITLPSASAAI